MKIKNQAEAVKTTSAFLQQFPVEKVMCWERIIEDTLFIEKRRKKHENIAYLLGDVQFAISTLAHQLDIKLVRQ